MLHAPLTKLLAVFFIFSLNCLAQNFAETHTKIRAAVENREYSTAAAELQNLERTSPKIFALNNYDYLLARTAEKRGDFALAALNYEKVVRRNSVLTEYALWHLAQIARAGGNLMLEQIYLRQLLVSASDSLLKDAASKRLMRNSFESGDYEAVVRILSRNDNSPPPPSTNSPVKNQTGGGGGAPPTAAAVALRRENLLYLGRSYLRLGQNKDAREIFDQLIVNSPNPAQPDDFALASVRGLDEIDGSGGGGSGKESSDQAVPQISVDAHFRRAVIYQFNRDFAAARLHYRAIVERFPQYIFAPEAMYQIGRGYAQEENYNEAIQWFERVRAEHPSNPVSRDALSQAASAYSRVNKPKEAIARYQKFIENYPSAENLDRAYLNIIDVKRDSGEEHDALKWTQKTREIFRGKIAEALALFSQARIHIAQNDWASALVDLNELLTIGDLGGTRVAGGTNKPEITFLKGFVLENLERYPEAVDVYLSIPDGRNEYYGWRATERLRALATGEKSKPFVETKLAALLKIISDARATTAGESHQFGDMQKALRLTNNAELQRSLLQSIRNSYEFLSNQNVSPSYKIQSFKLLDLGRREVLQEPKQIATGYHHTLADELLFLGLYDEAAPELEVSESGGKGDNVTDFAYTLAVFYNRGNMSHRAVSFMEPLWRQVPADYQVELMPREQVALLYPAPYTDSLLDHAPERNVDARLLLSIMRQESRYRPDVKSYAAARGLMQFISSTSERMAAELELKNFRQDDLYHPPTAILFGSQYLADLFRQFPAQPQAVAASYNGGENNVARWTARSKTNEADRYVPEIVFSQSKDYVYRVMANYRVYQHFYDEKLKMK